MATKSKQSSVIRAYLIKGDDDFRKQQELDQLLATLVKPEFADFDLERLNGDSATADRVMAGLFVPPFSSSQRVVLIRYANKMEQTEQEKLAASLGKTPDSACLVLVSPAPEKVDGRPKKGSEVIGDLSRAVRKIGKVITVGEERGKEKTDRARAFAQRLFAEAGKKIDPNALTVLLQRVGTDYSVINSEAQKLIDYAGSSGHITAVDVGQVTSETPEERIFKLIDAVAARKQSEALRMLDEHFQYSDSPEGEAPKTLAVIARQIRLLWQVKMLQEAGARGLSKDSVPANLQAALPSDPNVMDLVAKQRWQAERLTRQAKMFSRADLARCLYAIASADLMLKGIEGNIEDPRAVMEILVLELARARNG